MATIDQLLKAFQDLDFEALPNLLKDNPTCMNVPTSLFLERLKDEIEGHNISEKHCAYENLVEGVCGYCNKGCKVYKFMGENRPSFSLLFDEINGKVTNINLCNSFNGEGECDDEENNTLYLHFYEDEMVDFLPSPEYQIALQKIEQAKKDFNQLTEGKNVQLKDLIQWYNKYRQLEQELGLDNPFISIDYKAYFDLIYPLSKLGKLKANVDDYYTAIKGMMELKKINENDEKGIVRWLLMYEKKHFESLTKTENWKETGILVLDTKPPIRVDCSAYLDSFLFCDFYHFYWKQITSKYYLNAKELNKIINRTDYSIRYNLMFHNAYLDLL